MRKWLVAFSFLLVLFSLVLTIINEPTNLVSLFASEKGKNQGRDVKICHCLPCLSGENIIDTMTRWKLRGNSLVWVYAAVFSNIKIKTVK